MGSTAAAPSEVVGKLRRIGQEHVLTFFDSLDEAGRAALLRQIESLDLDSLPGLIGKYVRAKPAPTIDLSRIEPAPYYPADHTDRERGWARAKYESVGHDLLHRGKVAAFTVAGGQGTRLGFDGPKGAFPGSAVTGKPLFQCIAEWVLAAKRRYGRTVPWYIMTSPQNHDATLAFFDEHEYFGVSRRDVMFFPQGVMPSLEMGAGRLLLDQPGLIATNPDGHGGSLKALWTGGAIDDMRARGVEQISYVQIDNPLARVVDPVFLGLHAAAPDSSGEMSSKMVAKTEPGEKVGVFARAGGRTCVVEYSDLPRELAERRRAEGRLLFDAGSIAIHIIGVEFVAQLNASGRFALPPHRAEKKVPHIDLHTGGRTEPDKPNAVKLETFVFDALPLCESSIVYETIRKEEFAPIKNAEGADSPDTSRAIQTERAARWLQRAGVKIPRRADGTPDCTLEISPLTAMDPEDLDPARLPREIKPGARLAI